MNTGYMFFQRRGSLILALCGLYHRIVKRLLSCRRAVAWVCVYSLVFGFSLSEFCYPGLDPVQAFAPYPELCDRIFFFRRVLQ